jgi:endonuclease III
MTSTTSCEWLAQHNHQGPGAIDLARWLIGRQWCHAGDPDCPACVLIDVCPKQVERAADVRGV